MDRPRVEGGQPPQRSGTKGRGRHAGSLVDAHMPDLVQFHKLGTLGDGSGEGGDGSEVAPPVPIPNTVVQRLSADDTGGGLLGQ